MTRITAFTFLVFFANVLLVPATVLSFIQDATQNVLLDAKVDVDIKVPVVSALALLQPITLYPDLKQ